MGYSPQGRRESDTSEATELERELGESLCLVSPVQGLPCG